VNARGLMDVQDAPTAISAVTTTNP
jgi:hypothetical protein